MTLDGNIIQFDNSNDFNRAMSTLRQGSFLVAVKLVKRFEMIITFADVLSAQDFFKHLKTTLGLTT